MGDGKFGSAFAQDDGHAFKEESSGKTITVKYSAGVNGFSSDIEEYSVHRRLIC